MNTPQPLSPGERLAKLEETQLLVASGFAGVNKKGTIVDRRIDPSAVPMQKNDHLRIPEPKKL